MSLKRTFLIANLFLFMIPLVGCLKTRAELEAEQSGQQMQKQTQTQQRREAAPYKEKAPPSAYRFEEYDEQMRNFSGKMDGLEEKSNQLYSLMTAEREAAAKDKQLQEQKLAAYEEALKKLESEMQQLNEQIAQLKAAQAPAPAPSASHPNAGSKAGKTPYDEGEEHFNARNWKQAIFSYQQYREKFPKGKLYGDATYKIGVCFQELGQKEDARAFFDEVSSKFPKSKEAKKASIRMKSLR